MPSLEIVLKSEFLPNELYCFSVLLNLGDLRIMEILLKNDFLSNKLNIIFSHADFFLVAQIFFAKRKF
jgi:hypothetical protein